MPTAYILIGPPGCGKSTWREAMLPTLNDPVVISTDDCYDAIAEATGQTYTQVWDTHSYDDMVKKERVKLVRATMKGCDVIIDQTNCQVTSRALFRPNIPKTYKVVGVVFEFDEDEVFRRVRARGKATGKVIPPMAVKRRIDALELPLKGEFDEVITVPRG